MPIIPEKAALKLCENALDGGYLPGTLSEALQIIAELRGRIAASREGMTAPERLEFGMRRQEWILYCALRDGRVKSARTLVGVLYSGVVEPPRHAEWCVRHAIQGVRGKLPVGECIRTIMGEGYLWQGRVQ